MRGVLALAVGLAGCSFSPQPANGTPPPSDDASTGDGAPMPDAPADAPPDAPSACIAHATETSAAGHHYFKTDNATWVAAQAACIQFGGHLVKVETQIEDDFIIAQFAAGGGAQNFIWIGLSDPTDNDVYVWADGDVLLPTDHNSFQGGLIPVDGSNNCIDSDGTWETFDCNFASHGGVCECE